MPPSHGAWIIEADVVQRNQLFNNCSRVVVPLECFVICISAISPSGGATARSQKCVLLELRSSVGEVRT